MKKAPASYTGALSTTQNSRDVMPGSWHTVPHAGITYSHILEGFVPNQGIRPIQSGSCGSVK